jgi:hypothetical protein
LRKDGSTPLTSLHGPSGDAHIKPSLEKPMSSKICNCNAKTMKIAAAFAQAGARLGVGRLGFSPPSRPRVCEKRNLPSFVGVNS